MLTWPAERLAAIPPRVRLATLLGLVALAGAAGGVWLWSERAEQQAAAAYAAPLVRLSTAPTGSLDAAARSALIRDLEAALARYPSAGLAAEAAYELGRLRFAERDYARARAAWQTAIASGAGPTMRILARAGIGATWEAEGRLAEAVAAYREALADAERAGGFYQYDLLLALGRLHERRGDPTAAAEHYRRVLREQPAGPRADEARWRLSRLGVAD
jgi:tetratricopeptide (TPR) repeat protein